MRINKLSSIGIMLVGAILVLSFVLGSVRGCISQQQKEKIAITHAYTEFRAALIDGNIPAAFDHFTPIYKSGRTVDRFGEKFGFVQEKEYEVQSKSTFNIRRGKAVLIPWSGLRNVASGAGFEFERIGTNWFLTGELTCIQTRQAT